MKLKHTPGPWGQNDTDPLIICKEDSESYEFIAEVNGDEGFNENLPISNARLTAASPEMLEALIEGMKFNIEYGCLKKCALKYKTDDCKDCPKMRKIKAIEKATGLPVEEVLKDN